jgi:hypothetical protein
MGQRGELRQGYRQGQEDQLGALGLVINALVVWTTRYLEAAIDQVESSGMLVRDEDVKRLSPLAFRNINLHGRYPFSLPQEVAEGELRPLCDLRELDEPDV